MTDPNLPIELLSNGYDAAAIDVASLIRTPLVTVDAGGVLPAIATRDDSLKKLPSDMQRLRKADTRAPRREQMARR